MIDLSLKTLCVKQIGKGITFLEKSLTGNVKRIDVHTLKEVLLLETQSNDPAVLFNSV